MSEHEDKGDLLGTVLAVLVIAACMLMRACAKIANMG